MKEISERIRRNEKRNKERNKRIRKNKEDKGIKKRERERKK